MQRPIMDPSYVLETPLPPEPRRRFDWAWFLALARALRTLGRLLISHPFRRSNPDAHLDDTPAWRKVLLGVSYRLMFLPIALTLLASAMVYLVTHPPAVSADGDPGTVGVFADPVTLLAADGVRSEAWLAPVVDARKVVEQRDRVLKLKSPGVVLVHDMGQSPAQLLPLVKPLHDAGFVVLAIHVRGGGSAGAVGQTFGLNERLDVKAAVEMLRRRPFVDGTKIAVVGQGSGAVAGLLAAAEDASLRVVAIDAPPSGAASINDAFRHRFAGLGWLTPVCRWTFEIAYQTSADDLGNAPAGVTALHLDRADARAIHGFLAEQFKGR